MKRRYTLTIISDVHPDEVVNVLQRARHYISESFLDDEVDKTINVEDAS